MLKIFSNKGEENAIPLNAQNLNYNFAEIINMLYPVGTYFHTSDAEFNPNEVWCGTWELEFDGTVLVSKSNTSDSKFNAEVGNIVGEETNTLTIQHMPKHQHKLTLSGGSDNGLGNRVVMTNWEWSEKSQSIWNTIQDAGESQPHNNVQPSKICFRWHRIA